MNNGSTSKDRILRQALELFSEKGYDATSTREICAAAGITKPTLYYFFQSKEGLYRALVDDTLESFRDQLTQTLQTPGTAEQRLKQVARDFFLNVREKRDLMRFVFALVHSRGSAAPPTDFPRYYAGLVALIARVVDGAVADGDFEPGPTPLRMLVYMGALGEALTGYVLLGEPDLTPDLADALVDIILRGWKNTCD
jgi:TetR/AcrR family transcriptional regulator